MPYKLAQLTVSPERKSEILGRVFVSQPSMEEEQIMGKLFVLMEIKNHKTDIMLANFIIDRINLFYYQNEQVPLLTRLATISPSDIFENSLAKLNQDIVAFVQAEKIALNLQDFNITIGVFFKNKLYFTGIGHNKALLIYKSKIKNNRQINDYNLMNITSSTADPTQEIVLDNKLFTNTITGAIPPSGYIVFTNEPLYEFLSEKQLVKIITTLPPSGAAEQIKNILEETNIYMPFIGLIIKNQQITKPTDGLAYAVNDPRVKAEPSPIHHSLEPNRRREQEFRQERDLNKESIKALNRTAAKTAQILRPPGFINLEHLKKILRKFKLPATNPKQNKLIVNRRNLSWLKREGVVSLSKLGNSLIKIVSIISQLFTDLFSALTKKDKSTMVEKAPLNFRQRFGRRHFIALGFLIVCIIGLMISLHFTSLEQTKRAKAEAFTKASEEFAQKEKQINADLIYSKDRAILNFEGLDQVVATLKNNTDNKHLAELTDIEQRYQNLSDQLSGLIRLNNPEIVWALNNDQNPDNLTYANNKLYLASASNRQIIQWDLSNQTSQTVVSDEDNLRLLNTDRDNHSFFLGQDKLISLDQNGVSQSRNITNLSSNLAGGNIYNNRLYLFDQTNQQILRYNLNGSTIANPDSWLQAIPPAKVNDLAVNTSVFLLSDQQIFKYDGGLSQPFLMDTSLIPTLTQATKLIAPANTDLLAVLEPATKRLIVFSRNGKLLSQYTSDVWDKLKAVTIEPTGKTAYVLNGNTVYKINLAQNK